MSLSNWLCNCNNKIIKSQFVMIIYPGGRVELHDRPILAADVNLQNPKLCLAYPHVFQKPWAIVEPQTLLMLGQKFYVVPITTVRKLQRFSIEYSPVNHHHHDSSSITTVEEEDRDDCKDSFFSDRLNCYFYWMLKFKGSTRWNCNNNKSGCFRWRESPKRFL